MHKINWTRLMIGGLSAGLVLNVLDSVVNNYLLADQWAAAMQALGKAVEPSAVAMIVFYVLGFLIGIFAVWLYAAIQPRYGAGPRTAIYAALAVWLLAYVFSGVPGVAFGILPVVLMGAVIAAGVVEIVVATLLGAWLYREEDVPEFRSAWAAKA
jgi:NhaP-type Na+/H+ or K+/H+ antiporter